MDIAWEFNTDRFTVRLEIRPEDMPYDGDDDDGEIARKIADGTYAWFWAKVSVCLDGREIGSDSLGGCCYADVAEFYEAHRDADPMQRNCTIMRAKSGSNVSICHYFPDMVRQAIADARRNLGNVPKLRVA